MAIDFTLSDEQRQLQSDARAFARSVLGGVKEAIAKIGQPDGRFYATRPFYREMARAGFVKSLIPRQYGGSGLSTVDLALAAEELAAVDANVPTTLLATGLGLQPVIQFGTEAQKREFLPGFVENGEDRLAAFAFTEVTGGANFDSPDPSTGVRTFARREGDEWIINGHKHYTTNGTGWDGKGAHVYTLICRTDLNKAPQESLAVIAVPGDSEGIRITGMIDTMGHRAVSSPRIHFDEVRVPVANILGRPGTEPRSSRVRSRGRLH
jgi:nitroalkane oxidase